MAKRFDFRLHEHIVLLEINKLNNFTSLESCGNLKNSNFFLRYKGYLKFNNTPSRSTRYCKYLL